MMTAIVTIFSIILVYAIGAGYTYGKLCKEYGTNIAQPGSAPNGYENPGPLAIVLIWPIGLPFRWAWQLGKRFGG